MAASTPTIANHVQLDGITLHIIANSTIHNSQSMSFRRQLHLYVETGEASVSQNKLSLLHISSKFEDFAS